MPRPADCLVRAANFAAGAGALAALALTLRRWCFNTAALDAVYYAVHPAREPYAALPFVAAALAAAVVAAWITAPHWQWCRKLLPAWLWFVLLGLPAGFPNLAAALAVGAWCVWRVAGVKTRSLRWSPRLARLSAWLLALAAAAWSFHLQTRAYASLFLAYQDWGEYTECYLKLADGNLPWRSFLVQAGHFNLLPNLLMTALLRVWRSPDAVFMTSALLAGSLPLLAYRLGRAYRLPRSAALAGAVAAALNPVFVNQSLSLFYGFHPVLFLGPAILGFFICERRKCRWGMAATLALSLLVQETAAVLWFGYALYLLSRRDWRRGIALGAFCIVWFAAVSRIVIPFASTAATNPQLFHYAQLGDSLSEVLLSPFLRPRAFAATLGQYPNWCFVAALLLPCGVPALRAPRRLLIAVPLLAGVLLQHSSEVKNPVMQYGFELSVLVLAAAVAAAGALLRRRDEAGKYALRAGLRTMMATTLLCALGWGRLPRGLYSARAILDRPDATEVVAALRRLSADGERVLSTKRLRLYHMFDRSVGAPDDPLVPGDTVILDLDDALESAGMLRRRIIADERAMPVYSTNFYGRHFAVWKIAPPGTPRPGLPFLRRCGEREFAALGEALPQDDPAFGARLVRTAAGGALLLLRVNDAVAYDVAIDLRMRQAGKNIHRRLRFGDGVYPAWCAKPGEVYTVALPGVFPEAVRLRLLRCD